MQQLLSQIMEYLETGKSGKQLSPNTIKVISSHTEEWTYGTEYVDRAVFDRM